MDYTKADVYRTKAIATRRRRAAADKRLKAEFATRRLELQAKLDAIVAGRAAAELDDLIEGRLDDEYHASGGW